MSNWEIVGGKKGNKNIPNKKKNTISSAVKISSLTSSGVAETKTIFEAFLEKERRNEDRNKNNNVKRSNESSQQQAPVKKKNAPIKAADNKVVQVGLVTAKELKYLLELVKTKFPDTPSIWLKDLASLLNSKMVASGSNDDPTFSKEEAGYPMSSLNANGAANVIRSAVAKCSDSTLSLFYEHCLTWMVRDELKSLPTVGYRACLQCLAQERPHIVSQHCHKLVELRNTYQNRQQLGLSLLWAAGQVKHPTGGNVPTALAVWLELFFPVISMKGYSKYVIEYLQDILKVSAVPSESVSAVLGVREFFPIFDLVHSSGSPQALKQLSALFPRLRDMAYGPKPDQRLRLFFPSYLTRLDRSNSVAKQKELLQSLVDSLCRDKQSYSVWRQLYTKHLLQSSILLEHLDSIVLPSNFPRQLLKETLNAFRVTNEEIIANKKSNQQGSTLGIQECLKHSQALLLKMSAFRFPWRLVFFLFVGVALSVILFDVGQSGSFAASRFGSMVNRSGILLYAQQANKKIQIYSSKIYKNLEQMVPVYYSRVCSICSPHLQLLREWVVWAWLNVWEMTQPIRDWLNENVPSALAKANRIIPRLATDGGEVINNYVVIYFKIGFKFAMEMATAAQLWLTKHVFTSDFHRSAGSIADTMTNLTISAYQWIVKAVSNI